jgi:hypothetical protein
MCRNLELESVLEELKAVGLEPMVAQGGKHLKVLWSWNGQKRVQGIACTSGDRFGAKMARCRVRRTLRKDGLL